MIVSPMMAITIGALAFEITVGLVLRRWPRSILARAGAVGMCLSAKGEAVIRIYAPLC